MMMMRLRTVRKDAGRDSMTFATAPPPRLRIPSPVAPPLHPLYRPPLRPPRSEIFWHDDRPTRKQEGEDGGRGEDAAESKTSPYIFRLTLGYSSLAYT